MRDFPHKKMLLLYVISSPYAMLDHVLGGDVNPGVPPGTYQGIFTTFDQVNFSKQHRLYAFLLSFFLPVSPRTNSLAATRNLPAWTTPGISLIKMFCSAKKNYKKYFFSYVYVPPKCTDDGNECLLHFHFHGCQMYAGKARKNLHKPNASSIWANCRTYVHHLLVTRSEPTLSWIQGSWNWRTQTTWSSSSHRQITKRNFPRLYYVCESR